MPGEAFIYDVIRTPRGRNRGGSLHSVKPLDLVTGLVTALRERHPGLDPALVDDIVLGVVSPVGEQGADVARTTALAAGLPETVPGVQLNRFCASGLEAVNVAAQKVASGFEDLVLAGGVESMSRVPLGSDGGAIAHDPAIAWDTGFVPQGIGADLIATIERFTRPQVDAYAAESQRRAERAWADGRYTRSTVPVTDINGRLLLDTDEHRRPGTTAESLAALPAAFARIGEFGFDQVALARYPEVPRINHVHTAGNSSGIVDGAALAVIGSRATGTELGLRPRARIVQTAVVGSDPTIMLTGPGPATRKALERAGLTASDIDLFEVNEAFASVVMRWMREMEVPHEKVNVNGGAIALGHPLGATGAMLVATLLDELERRDLHRGLVTLCVGSGMGIATIIERV
ncbi:acetyl-CoA C-acetyltransferase [Microbacterium sp. MPKO10]|uniref:acetyl-CoA C-acetyltransferase n=1 Tax=Microbacterium sp. MPKO10 TaxID=2989818 RepID=UPI002236AFBC|nr:acetyl-CoA C-acetyltransferase [Microbacterium sp. MPKO10]MCW4457283.1 acetyl-CoA C-acetyltransferase [Microbacterium sp. MPKO10]